VIYAKEEVVEVAGYALRGTQCVIWLRDEFALKEQGIHSFLDYCCWVP